MLKDYKFLNGTNVQRTCPWCHDNGCSENWDTGEFYACRHCGKGVKWTEEQKKKTERKII